MLLYRNLKTKKLKFVHFTIMSNNRPIGVFDSGIGGLSVVSVISDLLPSENIIYLGDTQRVPYGSKDPRDIKKYSSELVDFLLKKDVKAIVVACNTISAVALDEIKNSTNLPIIDVINPTVEYIIENIRKEEVALIGTKATIDSKVYEQKLKLLNLKILTIACPQFVTLVEEGEIDSQKTQEIIKSCLLPIREENIDTVILGCTHFPALKEKISEILGGNVELIDPSSFAAQKLNKVLYENKLLNESSSDATYEIYLTGDLTTAFNAIEKIYPQKLLGNLIKVDLPKNP